MGKLIEVFEVLISAATNGVVTAAATTGDDRITRGLTAFIHCKNQTPSPPSLCFSASTDLLNKHLHVGKTAEVSVFVGRQSLLHWSVIVGKASTAANTK